LLAVWPLLSLVDRGAIFTRRAVRWVDVIVACAAVATVLSAGVLVHMLRFVPGGGGPTSYFVAASVTGALGLALLMLVIRGVLESAMTDRTELGARV
jgi:Na+/melibiose symporter-like transporter